MCAVSSSEMMAGATGQKEKASISALYSLVWAVLSACYCQIVVTRGEVRGRMDYCVGTTCTFLP